MVESKIEKGEEAEEFGENEGKQKKRRVCLYLTKENIDWVKQHYGSLSAFVEKIHQDYVRAIEELK